jgi:hypothetical protein
MDWSFTTDRKSLQTGLSPDEGYRINIDMVYMKKRVETTDAQQGCCAFFDDVVSEYPFFMECDAGYFKIDSLRKHKNRI